jgi:hypothetical protein
MDANLIERVGRYGRFTSNKIRLKKKKPDFQTGFAIRSPYTLPVISQESDQTQVLGHCILRMISYVTAL